MVAAISEGVVADRAEWDAMHWDDRAFLNAGLARLMQVKYGFGERGSAQAVSSASDTVSDGVQGPDGLAAFGVQVTEEVPSE